MRNTHLHSIFLAGSAIALTWSAMPAAAQVETVVVTAERRSEDLQKAPVAATVFTEEDLKAHSVQGVDDLEFSTPSLTVGSNGQSTQINIRGIGKEDNSGTATAAVAVYRDGIGTISGFATGEPYYDIATVEVLRGPQGTFSGENAAGGAIFVNTKDADLNSGYTGYMEAGYANYDEKDLQGAVNLPLGDTLAVRLAFNHVDRNSFFHVWMDPAMTIPNPGHVGSRDYNSARVSITFQPTEAFQAKIKFDYNDLDNHGYAFGVVNGIPDGFKSGFLPDANNISTDPFVVGNNSTDNYAKDRSARGALDMRYTFDSGLVLRSVSGAQWLDTYIRNDDDGSAFMDRRQHIDATFKIFSEELTLVSPDTDRFNWILGAFYKHETLDFPPGDGFILTDATHYIPGVAVPELTIVWHTPRTTEAVFGQASYDLTDKLEIQLGLRGQHYINTEQADLALPVFGLFWPTYPGGAQGRDSLGNPLPLTRGGQGGYSESTLTGKLALNYKLNDEHFLYAFFASGTTTGGVSVVGSLTGCQCDGNPNFAYQRTNDVEVGWKGQLFDNHLFTQVGGFYDWLNDYQAYFIDASGRGTYQNLDGLSKLYGLEATAQAVVDNLSVDAGLSLIHSELGDGLIRGFGGLLISTSGKRQPYTPDVTAHVGIQYAFPIGDGVTLTPRADYSWTSFQTMTPVDQFFGTTAVDRIPEHGLLNLKLTYSTEKWDLEAFATNVTDEVYIEAHGGPGYNAYPNEPRRFGIRLHYNFDAGSR